MTKPIEEILEPRPEARHGLAEELRVHLVEVRPHLEAFVDLVGLQLADRDPAYQLAERVHTEIRIDFRKPHEGQRSTGTPQPRKRKVDSAVLAATVE